MVPPDCPYPDGTRRGGPQRSALSGVPAGTPGRQPGVDPEAPPPISTAEPTPAPARRRPALGVPAGVSWFSGRWAGGDAGRSVASVLPPPSRCGIRARGGCAGFAVANVAVGD